MSYGLYDDKGIMPRLGKEAKLRKLWLSLMIMSVKGHHLNSSRAELVRESSKRRDKVGQNFLSGNGTSSP